MTSHPRNFNMTWRCQKWLDFIPPGLITFFWLKFNRYFFINSIISQPGITAFERVLPRTWISMRAWFRRICTRSASCVCHRKRRAFRGRFLTLCRHLWSVDQPFMEQISRDDNFIITGIKSRVDKTYEILY